MNKDSIQKLFLKWLNSKEQQDYISKRDFVVLLEEFSLKYEISYKEIIFIKDIYVNPKKEMVYIGDLFI